MALILSLAAAAVVAAVLAIPGATAFAMVFLGVSVVGLTLFLALLPPSVGSIQESRQAVQMMLDEGFSAGFSPASLDAVERATTEHSEDATGSGVVPGARPESHPTGGRWSDPAADAVTFGAVAAAADLGSTAESASLLVDYVNPDDAAVTAYEHVAGRQFDGIFDLRSAFQAEGYNLASPQSLSHWKGHTFEQMVNDRVASWAGPDAVMMPENASFAGADATLFGHDVQYKAYADFRNIDNTYGDTLIVPEGTANMPADAMGIDPSAFDPAVLDEHSVLFTKGLGLEDVEGAWGSMADPTLAGDAADLAGDLLGDLAGDAAVFGLGAVIRSARSAHKRREALADDALRGRASAKVAKDGAIGGGSAAAGAILGGLIGGPIGAVVGGAAGGILGGMGARAIDEFGIAESKAAAQEALEYLRSQSDQANATASEAWTIAVDDVGERAHRLNRAYRQQISIITSDVRASLARTRELSAEEQAWLVRAAKQRVHARTWRRLGPQERGARKRWTAAAHGLPCRAETVDVLALVHAAPGGQTVVSDWLDGRRSERAALITSADAATQRLTWAALRERRAASDHLMAERNRITREASERLEPNVLRYQERLKEFESELRINGIRTDQ